MGRIATHPLGARVTTNTVTVVRRKGRWQRQVQNVATGWITVAVRARNRPISACRQAGGGVRVAAVEALDGDAIQRAGDRDVDRYWQVLRIVCVGSDTQAARPIGSCPARNVGR